ncbi:3 2-trans-enoyl-CoA isomerase mitochondrial precursor-like protein [Leptomonas seymouri]|uniref:Enoyl-CoA delta isomerase 1, mitochondrial n=1 Tax=Leptomonas seymouri TaxID=5684 RepID=A0A0N1PBS2_LEPSE|nr:3 2-trans-enoyl-CoA isomerase mitochondrial precursor-like protein [Leptomonas seymouri]|eukprot:KPI84080.1 3 2-trans-enoyl-CoA isomerase mitochondrial precursor-like protein [Leptomonas seymouri]
MRRITSLAASAALLSRSCSSNAATPGVPYSPADLVVVRESPLEGVLLLEMNNGRANVLTPEFIAAFLNTINEVCDPEKSPCRGLILTSKSPGTFSAGLDLNEFSADLSQDRFAHYWNQFQKLFTTLHSMPVPLVTAINGHAVAAGCVMALASDYRVMARRHPVKHTDLTIGITAVQCGIVAPPYVAGSMEYVVGFRKAEELLSLGTLVSADEALRIGLVDEVVDNPDEAVVPCLEFMEKLLELPSPAPYWVVKDVSRRRLLAPLCTHALRTQDTVNYFRLIRTPQVQETLTRYLRAVTGK